MNQPDKDDKDDAQDGPGNAERSQYRAVYQNMQREAFWHFFGVY